jgi:hypothetical protein
LAGETEIIEENLPQSRFVYSKSHMTWPVTEAGLPTTNRLGYGTAPNDE